MTWEPFDPTILILLAKQQYPDEAALHEALSCCTSAELIDDGSPEGGGLYFVDRMEGTFKQNVVLFWPMKGKIVLDLLEDGRIGGMSVIRMAFGEDGLPLPEYDGFDPEM